MNYDPSDPNTLANPYPYFFALRNEDPIHWHTKLKSWIITRYDDVRSILSSDNITAVSYTHLTLPTIYSV